MAVLGFEQTGIAGLYVIRPRVSVDERGSFVKTFTAEDFADAGMETTFADEFYTTSARNVVRGLHFQRPPAHQAKVVFCTSGRAFDVVLDLLDGSPTYGKSLAFGLTGPGGIGLYIPASCAHGFCALSDGTTLAYKVTTGYSPEHDDGVLWSSAPIDWPVVDPIVSERDKSFVSLQDFVTPFTADRLERSR